MEMSPLASETRQGGRDKTRQIETDDEGRMGSSRGAGEEGGECARYQTNPEEEKGERVKAGKAGNGEDDDDRIKKDIRSVMNGKYKYNPT